MLVFDVNVLVNAFHEEAKNHRENFDWLQNVIDLGQPFGFPEFVLFNFVRVVTLPRPWKRPATTAEALNYCHRIREVPRCRILEPTDNHWAIFDHLCRHISATGNLINDAYLAAFALDRGVEMITDDADFAKFPGLRWRGPLDTQIRTNPR